MLSDTAAADLASDGCHFAPRFAPEALLSALRQGFDAAHATSNRRNILQGVPAVRTLLAHPKVTTALRTLLGPGAAAVRGIFFDQNADANWAVPWHQDLSIAVAERPEHPPEGFGPWSRKAGVVHVEPPEACLAAMLTLRLHLDDCNEDNGALRVRPGTHLLGRLKDPTSAANHPEQAVVAAAGDALFMRPLLLHASSKAVRPSRRRIVHLEFARGELPAPLRWAARVPA